MTKTELIKSLADKLNIQPNADGSYDLDDSAKALVKMMAAAGWLEPEDE